MGFYNQIPIFQHLHVLEMIESGKGSQCAPMHARIEPTELCNFRCHFCCWYNADRHKTISSASFTGKSLFRRDRLLNLIDELIEIGTMAFSFSGGGDPLLYPWMATVLKKIADKDKVFGVTSNMAMNIRDDLFNELAKAAWIRWSMNAGTLETYLKIHKPIGLNGHNIFERVKYNIRQLIRIRNNNNLPLLLNASYVVSDQNRHDILHAAALAKELGVDCISFRKDTPVIKQYAPNNYTEDEERDILSAKERFETNHFKVYINYDRLEDIQMANDPELFCYYSNHSVYIAADGKMYPCCYTRLDTKYAIGNVNHSDFKKLWESKKRQENYKHLLFDKCPTCAYGQTIRALKPLYEGGKKARDVFMASKYPNYFI